VKTRNKIQFIVLLFLPSLLSAQLSFNSPDSLFAFADKNSNVSKTSIQQSLLAKWTKIAALGNSINFRNPLSFSATDNFYLPVNFIPAEIFGGPAGTFRDVRFGQQYVSNFNFNPQIDIINPSNLARVKSAEINKEMTEIGNQLSKKNLYESIAGAYYNCVSLQEQIILTEKTLAAADSLYFIVNNRYKEGISREQDANNARVNQLSTADKLAQLKLGLEQQINSVKILCDIPSGTMVKISANTSAASEQTKAVSTLQYKYSMLQNEYARNEMNVNRLSMFPIISLVYYQSWQKNSNTSFTDSKATWFQSKYVGLRITLPFPPEVSKLSQSYTSKINYRIAWMNAEHTKLQNELNNQTMNLEYEKSASSYEAAKQIAALKSTNYDKSVNQYNEGILSADLLLTAFSDLLISRLNLASAQASMEYNKTKIRINNQFK
jgi:OMF family outer membrane factor